MLQVDASQEILDSLFLGLSLSAAIDQACQNHPYRPIKAKIPKSRYDIRYPVQIRIGDCIDFGHSRLMLQSSDSSIFLYQYNGKIFNFLVRLMFSKYKGYVKNACIFWERG